MAEKVDNLTLVGIDLQADSATMGFDERDPALHLPTGTKRTGYSDGTYGPFRCVDCLHFASKDKSCNNRYVLQDYEIKDLTRPNVNKDDLASGKESAKKEVDPKGCCSFFRDKEEVKAAAEMPKIVGFSPEITKEIREYLINFSHKLLHHTKKIFATDLAAIHGKYMAETQTILLNPKNFTNALKFGTHDPADIDQHVLAHELGHGLYLSLDETEQKDWRELSNWQQGSKKGQALPYVEKRPGWPHKLSNWTHGKDAKFAREYQKKSPSEDFADNVAYISTGNESDVPETKRDFIQKYL